MNKEYHFIGIGKRQTDIVHPESPDKEEPYISSYELIQAVNLSILLNRPLLLEGEAGCGKSRLAHAIAYELGIPLFTWHIKSTSKAQEGLYTYDAILRLHDVHTIPYSERENKSIQNHRTVRDPSDPKDYRKFGPLGKAFSNLECPSVVLIDEIDKADIDFPNDLLTVLDEPWEFEIPETGEIISAKKEFKPIVIITSNKEKGNLPIPFLRRCIYHYVPFPDSEEKLKRIIESHYELKQNASLKLPSEFIDFAIKKFLTLRNNQGLFKKPGTSEFLDWLKALEFEFCNKPDSKLITQSTLPFPGVLIKLRTDWTKFVSLP